MPENSSGEVGVKERYVAFRHELLGPIDVDISPVLTAFMSLLVALMAAHFFRSDFLFLGGVLTFVHGFMEILTSELVHQQEGTGKEDTYLMMLLERLSEIVLLIGLGLSSFVSPWLSMVLIGLLSMVYFTRLYAKEYFGEPFHVRLYDRGIVVAFIGMGGLLKPLGTVWVEYALYTMMVLFSYYVLKSLVISINRIQESDEKEA
jgi:hypothetical protein